VYLGYFFFYIFDRNETKTFIPVSNFVIIYVKKKVIFFQKIAPNCSPCLIQPPHIFYKTIFAFCSRTFGHLATALLSCLVGKVLDEQKEKVLCGKTVLHCGSCPSRLSFLYDHFCGLQPNFRPPWQQHSSLAWLAKYWTSRSSMVRPASMSMPSMEIPCMLSS
jgi:hypothetical protein